MPTVSADGKYYIDLSADPLFAPGNFVSTYPEQLAFDDQIGNGLSNNGVGNCSWQYSLSALDQDGGTVVTGHDFIGPYRTYYRLRYGNVVIQAGPTVSWTTILGSDIMSVAGKTWEHYLERWMYPFDGRTNPDHTQDYKFTNTFQNDEITGSGVLTPAGLVYQASLRDVIRIFSDIFSTTMNVPNRQIFDISNLASLSGVKTNYQLTLGDTSFMNSLITSLAGIGIGFDWWISHDKKIFWATPYRYGNNSSPTIIYTFDGSDDAHTPDDLEFTNNGPAATHVEGTGAGLATATTLARAYGDSTNQIVFTRLDQNYDFGDVRNVDELIAKTQKQLSLDLNPQHIIPLKVNPARISNFWSTFRKGRAIYINYEMIAHKIDSPQQLVSYNATTTDEGEVVVDFTLKQIYNTVATAGTAEG